MDQELHEGGTARGLPVQEIDTLDHEYDENFYGR